MRRLLVLVVFLAVAGCDAATPSTPPPSGPSSAVQPTGAAGSGRCAVPAIGPVDAGSVLVPGPTNGLPASDAVGERLTFVATVLGPDCRPVPGATVRVFHTDARGLYGPGSGADECCYYGGTVTTDANGRFRLDTIRPAEYPQAGAPPAHIHVEIRHDVGRLDTEVVFDTGTPPPGQVGPDTVVPVELTRSGAGWYGGTAFVVVP